MKLMTTTQQADLEEFQAVQAKFFALRNQMVELQKQAEAQEALARENQETIAEYEQVIGQLVRGETTDKSLLRELALKQAEARILTSQYQKFAEDLKTQAEALRTTALGYADRYIQAWRKAFILFAKEESEAVYQDIEARLLLAVKLKMGAINPRYGARRIAIDELRKNIDYEALKRVLDDISDRVAKRIHEISLSTEEYECLSLLGASGVDIRPFTDKELDTTPFQRIKLRQTLGKTERQQAA